MFSTGILSMYAAINASIIQGSVLGPSSYIVVACDRHPKMQEYKLLKFADDTHLLVGSMHIHTVADEIEDITQWTITNNLSLNPHRTRDLLILRKPRLILLING